MVADPAFDRRWHASLGSLSGAQEEVKGLAPLYPEVQVLAGKDATPDAVAAAMRGREVLHFATHALVDATKPEASLLALTPPGREPSAGDLKAGAIERLPLAGARLVVLASCRGAAGEMAPGEGSLSLSRSFLAAGVPAVVAGLWDLDDRTGAKLFVRFHQVLRSGEDPVTALRKIQLEAVSSSNKNLRSPRAWGSLQVIGAVAHHP
jgi:CHAT domain-containing protein